MNKYLKIFIFVFLLVAITVVGLIYYKSGQTVTGQIQSEGGTIGNNILSYSVAKGVFPSVANITLKSIPRNKLPSSIPNNAKVYAAVEVNVTFSNESSSSLTPSINYATVKAPLYQHFNQGMQLVVLEPTLTGDNWKKTGQLGTVDSNGKSVTFQAATDGQFILMLKADINAQN